MKVLLPQTRELCYYSGGFFLDKMEEALEALSVEVKRLSLSLDSDGISGEKELEILEDCLEEDFDAVIDINSHLPYLVMEDDEPYPDRLGAPFFNYILDHPLYHHPGLSRRLKDCHALSIDHFHRDYMERYYPNLRSVTYLPVAGTEALTIKPYGEREIPLLFTGTYLPEEIPMAELKALGEETFGLGTKLIEAWQPTKEPMEDALIRVLSGEGAETADGDIPVLMNRMYPVDRVMRNRIRVNTLKAVAMTGTELTIMGEGWEGTELSSYPNITFKKPRTISLAIDAMGNSKAVLDINPLFYSGLHDRVTSSLANGSLTISTMSRKAERALRDGENIIYLDPEDRESVLSGMEKYLTLTESRREEIAEAGRKTYEERYSWEVHAGTLIDLIEGTN